MRILYLIDSLGSGGAERSTALLQGPLRNLGVETRIATLYRAADGDETIVRAQGVEVTVLPGSNDLIRALSMRRLVRMYEPDIVHTCLYRSDQVGRWATVFTGVPVVSSLVGVPQQVGRGWDGYPPRWKLLLAIAFDAIGAHLRTKRFHAVTARVARQFISRYRIPEFKVSVIERGRDASLHELRTSANRTRVRRQLGVPDDAPLVVSVGRIDRQKQHDHLVEACSRLLDTMPEMRVIMVGRDGDGRQRLDTALKSIGGRRSAFMELGYRDDAVSIIAAADVFVLHSRNEGAAGAAVEALGIGTPVVSYPLPGLADVQQNERNSLVVAHQLPQLLADAVGRVLRDAETAKEFARVGQADFKRRFELDASAERFRNFYLTVSRTRRCVPMRCGLIDLNAQRSDPRA